MEPTQSEAAIIPAAPPQPPQPPPAPAPAVAVTPRVTVEQLISLPESEDKRNWIRSLVEAEVARQNFQYDKAMAREFAASGQFDDINGRTQEQSIATMMVKIQMGRAWGFNAADAVRYIYFASGKPSVENELIASKLQQAGYDWDVEWLEDTVQHKGKPWRKCIGCTLYLKRWNANEQRYEPLKDRKGEQISVSFTEADADHAQIWEKGKQIPLSSKWNFQSWGRDMFYWRCISRVKKYHAPHVLRGAISREEALEMIPTDNMTPPMLPRELQPPAEVQSEPEPPRRPTLKEHVMSQQPSFLEATPSPKPTTTETEKP